VLYFDSLNGHDMAAGTQAEPKLDPSLPYPGCGGLMLRRGRPPYKHAARVTLQTGTANAPFVLGAWGDGAKPVLDAQCVVDLQISGIDVTYASVQSVDGVNHKSRFIHLGLVSGDPLTPRHISISDCEGRYGFGAKGCGGIMAWGSEITYQNVALRGYREDCLWHCGATFDATDLTLEDPSAWSEGGGDCIQVWGLSQRLAVNGLYLRKTRTWDKQLGYFRGNGKPLGVCQIDNIDGEGQSVGAGLVTLWDLPGLRGNGWKLNLTGGTAAAAIGGLGNMVGARVLGAFTVPPGRLVASGGVLTA